MSKKVPPVVPSSSPVLLGSSTNIAGSKNILEADLTGPITQHSTKKGLCLQTCSAPTIPRKITTICSTYTCIFQVQLSLFRALLSTGIIQSMSSLQKCFFSIPHSFGNRS